MCLALVFREALTLDAVTAPLVAGADKEDAWRFVGRLSPGASSLQLSFLVSLASGDVGSLRCRSVGRCVDECVQDLRGSRLLVWVLRC